MPARAATRGVEDLFEEIGRGSDEHARARASIHTEIADVLEDDKGTQNWNEPPRGYVYVTMDGSLDEPPAVEACQEDGLNGGVVGAACVLFSAVDNRGRLAHVARGAEENVLSFAGYYVGSGAGELCGAVVGLSAVVDILRRTELEFARTWSVELRTDSQSVYSWLSKTEEGYARIKAENEKVEALILLCRVIIEDIRSLTGSWPKLTKIPRGANGDANRCATVERNRRRRRRWHRGADAFPQCLGGYATEAMEALKKMDVLHRAWRQAKPRN